MANTKKDSKVVKYGDLTNEQKEAMHNDVVKSTSKPKTTRLRKSKDIENNKPTNDKDKQEVAKAISGKNARELAFDDKHIYLRIVKGSKEYKFIYKGFLFSDLNCVLVTNVCARYGVLGLADIPCSGDIYHKTSNKASKESANSIVCDMFLEASEFVTDELAKVLIEFKSFDDKLTNYLALKAHILDKINNGSKDWKIINYDEKTATNYIKALHNVAQSIQDKAKAFSENLSKGNNVA